MIPVLRRPIRYSDKEYWDQRYARSSSQFEWFYGSNGVRKVIRQYITRRKPILHIGCGNSTIQEGLGRRGYTVVNVDISPVVIEMMREKHKELTTLSYVVGDCRNMPDFADCSFGSAIDKGTLDALVCCKEADNNVRGMMLEISRVLQPGGVFLLITLGAPEHRLHMVNKPEYGWSLQVCLLPKTQDARLLPHNDAPETLDFLGPFAVGPDNVVQGLPQPFDPAQYFYCYACKKNPLELSKSKDEKARLPASWCTATKEAVTRLQQELGLPPDLQSRDKRKRTLRVQAIHRDSAPLTELSAVSQESTATTSSLRGAEAVQAWVARSLAEEDQKEEEGAEVAERAGEQSGTEAQIAAAVCDTERASCELSSTMGSSRRASRTSVDASSVAGSSELPPVLPSVAMHRRPAAAAVAAPAQAAASMPRCSSAMDMAENKHSMGGASPHSSSNNPIRRLSDGALLQVLPAEPEPQGAPAPGTAAQQPGSSTLQGSPSLQGQLRDLQLSHHEVCAAMKRLEVAAP